MQRNFFQNKTLQSENFSGNSLWRYWLKTSSLTKQKMLRLLCIKELMSFAHDWRNFATVKFELHGAGFLNFFAKTDLSKCKFKFETLTFFSYLQKKIAEKFKKKMEDVKMLAWRKTKLTKQAWKTFCKKKFKNTKKFVFFFTVCWKKKSQLQVKCNFFLRLAHNFGLATKTLFL